MDLLRGAGVDMEKPGRVDSAAGPIRPVGQGVGLAHLDRRAAVRGRPIYGGWQRICRGRDHRVGLDLGRHPLATRLHETGNYTVTLTAPLLWGSLGLSAPGLLFALSVGIFLAIACGYAVRIKGRLWTPPVRWLTLCWLIPGLDLLRLAGVPIPMTFLEPLLVAAVTGTAAGGLAEALCPSSPGGWRSAVVFWPAAVWLLAPLCCGWWYFQAQQAYYNYLLGYADFGHFGWRVASTWEGRGFLVETPSLPAFWDHFHPGLALFCATWGISARSTVVPLDSGHLAGSTGAGRLWHCEAARGKLGGGRGLGRRLSGLSLRRATQSELFLRLASDKCCLAVDLPNDLGTTPRPTNLGTLGGGPRLQLSGRRRCHSRLPGFGDGISGMGKPTSAAGVIPASLTSSVRRVFIQDLAHRGGCLGIGVRDPSSSFALVNVPNGSVS